MAPTPAPTLSPLLVLPTIPASILRWDLWPRLANQNLAFSWLQELAQV